MSIAQNFLQQLSRLYPHQPEYLQAVEEWLCSVAPVLPRFDQLEQQALLWRLCEPERIIQFRVCWMDDRGQVQVNRGYRVQHSSALGPYKGGMRFHPSVNLSILKFLAFEQTFKNSLTTLPMGSGKGGADFDPKGKSDAEIMRFCQAFMLELSHHIGADTDVPAGDIGVGGREIGYMNGFYKKLTHRTDSVLTGKGLSYGGSLLRPEATGYGLIYFVQNLLRQRGEALAGKTIAVSGSGNVAQFAIEKALALGGRVVSVSDSQGSVYDPEGFDADKLALLQHVKNVQRGRVADYAHQRGLTYREGQQPWDVPVQIALPCATQNEITAAEAHRLIANGVEGIAEGANMPSSNEAIALFQQAGVWFAPAKAANAGGVATSGLEMTQNAERLPWTREQVDTKLHQIMQTIHDTCVQYGQRPQGGVDYVAGANIAGFLKVAEATLAQGVV